MMHVFDKKGIAWECQNHSTLWAFIMLDIDTMISISAIWNLDKNNVCIPITVVQMEGAQFFLENWWYGQAITKQSM